MGIGATVRHASLATSAGTGTATTMPAPSTALDMTVMKVGAE
jgi:hypothetical protein